jgi:hypothetical protein
MPEYPVEKWDLFISHAFEDKESFVEPLASALAAFGVDVWYDRYTLRIGDSLSRSIDQGLAKSQYGLVVLSPAFIAKKWPEYELRGLTARELAGGKVILPIWHNISREDLLQFSPPLVDKLAIQSSGRTPIQIAVQIIKVIRPDIFTQILRRMAHYDSIKRAKVKVMDPRELHPSPIQHPVLPPELISRIRLVRASLLGAYTHSMEFWKDGFQRDSHPSKEIAFWEHLAAVYREYSAMALPLTREQHEKVIHLILTLSTTQDEHKLAEQAEGLPEGALDMIVGLYASPEPIYDIEEELPFVDKESESDRVSRMFQESDKEHFPNDLPEELIRKLMGTEESEPPK